MSNLTSPCPKCGTAAVPECIQDWADYEIVPVICGSCGTVFWEGVVSECQIIQRDGDDNIQQMASANTAFGPNARPVGISNRNRDGESDFPIGSEIEVILKEHILYGRVGVIVEKKHAHYQVVVDDRKITLPFNGIRLHHGRCTDNPG